MELSGAAARCYAACGRRRSAAAMRADVAAALAARGQSAAAAALYGRQAALLVGEGWPHLAASVLGKLAQCQEVGRWPRPGQLHARGRAAEVTACQRARGSSPCMPESTWQKSLRQPMAAQLHSVR